MALKLETCVLKSVIVIGNSKKYYLIERHSRKYLRKNELGEIIADYEKKSYITIKEGTRNKKTGIITYSKTTPKLLDNKQFLNRIAKEISEF